MTVTQKHPVLYFSSFDAVVADKKELHAGRHILITFDILAMVVAVAVTVFLGKAWKREVKEISIEAQLGSWWMTPLVTSKTVSELVHSLETIQRIAHELRNAFALLPGFDSMLSRITFMRVINTVHPSRS